MKFNRILSSALLVVMIFMTCIAVLPITASAAYSSETSSSSDLAADKIKEYVQQSYLASPKDDPQYASAEERLQAEMPYMEEVVFGDYILYVNKYTGGVYYKNKTTLFTFKDENGKTFVQPISQVKKFIEQKVQDRNIQTARYLLYQNLIKQYNLQISDDALLLLMKERGLKA